VPLGSGTTLEHVIIDAAAYAAKRLSKLFRDPTPGEEEFLEGLPWEL
jgi:hypothetical protein